MPRDSNVQNRSTLRARYHFIFVETDSYPCTYSERNFIWLESSILEEWFRSGGNHLLLTHANETFCAVATDRHNS